MVIDFFETFAEIGHNSFFLCLLRFLIASIIVGVRDYRSTLSKITDQFDKTLLILYIFDNILFITIGGGLTGL